MDDYTNPSAEYERDEGEEEEENAYDSEDADDQTQTQSTQQASQPTATTADSHLWGYLQPCSSSLTRIDFWKIHPRYSIGRNTEVNQVVLPGFKVSEYMNNTRPRHNVDLTHQGNQHCVIKWDGEGNSNVVVHDLSSNGTFVSLY